MKTNRTLRLLSLLGFLLLFAPFYDSCDDKTNGFVKTYDEYDANGKLIEKNFFQNIYNVVVDELSFNGFEIAAFFPIGVQEIKSFNEFKEEISTSFQKKDWYKNLGMAISILFDLIFFVSLLILILSFTNKINTLNKLVIVNTIIILLTFFYIIFLENSFKNWHQIKWGYYAFMITNLLLFYYSKPNKINT